MPLPLTIEQLLALVRKSNLVESPRLDAFLERVNEPGKETPSAVELARRMVSEGLITTFQSEQLLQGKWRGFSIGKYKVLERIGSGGMGSVYLCEHIHMRHKVAVKVLPIVKAQEHAALERFRREARAAALLNHPNLVRGHDIDQEGELHYLVMDYVDGVNLHRLISRRGPLAIDRACHYVYQAASGLDYAFRAGLVHRDIKPANILLDRSGTVKLLDLGLARFYEDNEDLLTVKYDDNNILGTADYVSPEQAHDSHDVDIRTDIYSLGATFYFLLTGQPLFPEGRVAQKLIWHQTRQPTSLRQIRSEIPAALEAVVERMIAKDRERRCQTPAEVMELLEPWVQTPIPLPTAEEIPWLSLAARSPATESLARTPSPVSRSDGRQQTGRVSRSHPSPSSHGPECEKNGVRVATCSQPSSRHGPESDHATPRALASEVPTARNGIPATPARTSQAAGAPSRFHIRRGRLSRLIFLSLALVIGAGAGVALRLSSNGATPASEAPEESGILVVARTGAPGTFATIEEALHKARPGDRIQVCATVWEEALRLDNGTLGHGVIIEGAGPDGPVTWHAPADLAEGRSLIYLSAVSSLLIRNFTIDGRGQVQHLITLSGPCPGTRLENLRLQGFRGSALHLTNCTGDEKTPVTLSNLQVVPGRTAEAGLFLEAFSDQVCRQVRVEGCTFEGPLLAGVVVTGPTSQITLRNNLFRKPTDGILCRRTVPSYATHLTLEANHFSDLQGAALHLEAPPRVTGSRLVLSDNRFERVRQLGQTDGFRPEPPRPAGVWVWAAGTGEHGFFRKTFHLAEVPSRAVLNITAAERFTVWFNGRRVGLGGLDASAPRIQAFDVAPYLQSGENVLAVEASGPVGAAGLFAELNDNGAGNPMHPGRTLVTDATWRVAPESRPGWQTSGFDDQLWTAARVLGPYGSAGPTRQPLIWESVVEEHFKYQSARVFPPPSGNQRDEGSSEGFPPFNATVSPRGTDGKTP
jgi:eukaryotic-like serine/threonine-protein kinase